MRAPEFWHRPSAAATLLAPLGGAYAAAVALRRRMARPRRVDVPVVCIGNLVAGGAGKTPVALAVARRLAELGRRPAFLSRGYGGTERGPLRVDNGCHDAATVGDEALLLARQAPAWVAADRGAGAQAAIADGAEVLVMDDGHQNPALSKDLSLVVVDGGYGFGNGRVMPAGPLREPVAAGLARASALVLLGADRFGVTDRAAGLPLLGAELEPAPSGAALRGRRVMAFAGIGRPEKFFATLSGLGAIVAAARPFPDHHPYTRAEVEALIAEARRLGAVPVTTAKDAVRLPPELRAAVTVLDVTVRWADPAALDGLLQGLWP